MRRLATLCPMGTHNLVREQRVKSITAAQWSKYQNGGIPTGLWELRGRTLDQPEIQERDSGEGPQLGICKEE